MHVEALPHRPGGHRCAAVASACAVLGAALPALPPVGSTALAGLSVQPVVPRSEGIAPAGSATGARR